MKAIELGKANQDLKTAIESLRIVEKPLPKPKPGQVLVKIEAAPCNPSDLLFLQGMYGVTKEMPAVPGWEGAGTVVESGGGFLSWWLKDKRVACGGQRGSDGTWAEYYIADAKSCIPLKKTIPFDQAATLLINPITAYGMVEKALHENHAAIVQTAACSQLGRMVQTLAKEKQIPLINIVRRDEQAAELIDTGEKYVLNSESPNFKENFKEISHDLNATIAFDAVGGSLTSLLFEAMPPHSTVLVYGALSGESCKDFSPLSLIFEQKKLEGFWLSTWIENSGFLNTFKATNHIQKLMEKDAFRTKIHSHASFEEWKQALLNYHQSMTKGKVILTPGCAF